MSKEIRELEENNLVIEELNNQIEDIRYGHCWRCHVCRI